VVVTWIGQFNKEEPMVRKRSKIKQTWLSAIFVEVFFLCVGEALEPIPVIGTLLNILGRGR
jgi:hypothetical protein